MNTEPLIIMVIVQLTVAMATGYFFWKVLKKGK